MSTDVSRSSNAFEPQSSSSRVFTVDAVIKPPVSRLHPLLIAAAVSVMIASGVVVANYTGLLPNRSTSPVETAGMGLNDQAVDTTKVVDAGSEPSSAVPAQAPAAGLVPPTPQAAPSQPASSAPQHAAPQHRQAARPVRSTHIASAPAAPAGAMNAPQTMPEPQPVPQVAPICRECGVVSRVQTIERPVSQGPGIGAIAGGLVGGLLGNQVGGGNGRKAMTVLGAAGGAFAGNHIEKTTRVEHRDRVEVQFQDGTSQIFNFDNSPVRQGDRVRVVNGQLVPE